MAKPGGDHAPRGIDIEMDILVRVFGFQEEHLGDDQIGHIVIDGRPEKDDSVFQKTGIDIIGPLASSVLFDHNRYQCHGVSSHT